ncbi:MAG: hypothetical protein HY718_03725 [Planctomycetes bacterium]|nr:hypothetical protein [Planctomycetota bacterium]
MAAAHANGQDWQGLIEHITESEFRNNGRFDAQTGPELAKRFLPLTGAMRGFWEGVTNDSREFLSPEQVANLQKWSDRNRALIDGAEEQMHRWAAGDVDKDGRPFRSAQPPQEDTQTPEQKAAERRQMLLEWARHRAERDLEQMPPEGWGSFIERSAAFFGFSDEQKTHARAIRDKYQNQVKAIMTPQWRTRVLSNRLKQNLIDTSGERESLEPWRYRLGTEYRELTEPVNKLADALRTEVVALATPEQRTAAVATVGQAAAKHGATAEELRTIEAVMKP